MKSKPFSLNVEKSQIENEIERAIDSRHPCIACPIGLVLPIDSSSRQELNIGRMYFDSCSLMEIISVNSKWWT
jgi:hypothetical protein